MRRCGLAKTTTYGFASLANTPSDFSRHLSLKSSAGILISFHIISCSSVLTRMMSSDSSVPSPRGPRWLSVHCGGLTDWRAPQTGVACAPPTPRTTTAPCARRTGATSAATTPATTTSTAATATARYGTRPLAARGAASVAKRTRMGYAVMRSYAITRIRSLCAEHPSRHAAR